MNTISSRMIYFFVIIVLSISILSNLTLKPVSLSAATKSFKLVEGLSVKEGEIAFVAFDFGPNTKAENQPQAEVLVEHLLRKRIPFVLFSQYAQAEGFLKSIPQNVTKKLEKESGETYEYGVDWVNLGFRPGASILIQNVAKSTNIGETFKQDANGTSLENLSLFKNVKDLKSVKLLAQFTGLVGTFDTYIQFFQTADYAPKFIHGCTSITIPEGYIYLDSGQLSGLLEGLVGAASYAKNLSSLYEKREEDKVLLKNSTALAIGQILIIFLVILGNRSYFLNLFRKEPKNA